MTVIGDTSGILAVIDVDSPVHHACLEVIHQADAVVLSPLVLAELDYMITSRLGYRTAVAFIDQVKSGVYDVAEVGADEIFAAKDVLDRYADLPIGLTDAVNVVLADNLGTDRVLTLDQRPFRAVRPLTTRFQAFRLSPFDI